MSGRGTGTTAGGGERRGSGGGARSRLKVLGKDLFNLLVNITWCGGQIKAETVSLNCLS